MLCTKDDIGALLRKASPDERAQLAEMLDLKTAPEWGRIKTSTELVKQIYWKYQTPVGYMTRDPAFDEICVDVAKQLKMGGLAEEQISCWQLLQRILFGLFEELYQKVPPSERKEWLSGVLHEEIKAGKFSVGGRDWTTLSAGVVLKAIQKLGGFTIYKVSVMVVNQVARVLVGRGLSLAGNVIVSRALSFALGPVGWALMIWGVNDLFGTNWKRVVPATLFLYCIHDRVGREEQETEPEEGEYA